MKLDDELAAIKARAETWAVYPTANCIAHAPEDISRLLAALELCIRQRNENLEALADEIGDCVDILKEDDAALLEILRGNE